MRAFKLLGFFAAVLAGNWAWSYPEMIRHGYVNCTACHISPSGGGALTQYGRNLAGELLTYQWGKKSNSEETSEQEGPAFRLGGELRVLQFSQNNEHENSKLFIPMQFNGEASYNVERWAAVLRAGVVGKREEEGGSPKYELGFHLPSAYVLGRYADVWHVRAGRFLPGYGLNNSMHFLGTRGGLGFGFNDQRAGLEVSRLGESVGIMAAVFGQRDEKIGENSAMVQVQYSPNDKSKIAVNYWRETDTRDLYGLWFVTPIYRGLYLSADWNRQKETDLDVSGHYYFTKLGYEIVQGVNAVLMSDNSQRDEERPYTQIDRLGPAIQFYPAPYFDVELAWLSEKNQLYSTQRGDYAYLLLHAYY